MASERKKLGKIYQDHYKTGIGAEVGCLRGEFSRFLSTQYQGKILSIDAFIGEPKIPDDPLTEEKCRKNLEGTKCELIKGLSLDVVKKIDDGSLDWIYIDADHEYEAVKADLEAWFPKVRNGGIISGHDYVKYESEESIFGVIEAVDEFCKKYGYKIEGLFDVGKFASWYFTK